MVSFLCGECSCQVKELNPGMDLPIVADWPAIFERIGSAGDNGPEPPPGTTRFGARAKPLASVADALAGTSKPGGGPSDVRVALYPPTQDTVALVDAAPGREPTPGVEPARYRRWLWGATVLAALLVLATGAWAWVHALRRHGQ